ncbi:MAG: MerR family transcriptional regulator [Tenericutes bacterium]|nr:MerR family transcriptional regulator [Mycoplasmatota bacterium]
MFYKIGEFSKLVDIPVKTLRYYDECDVLKPSKIDSFTGYRYYSDDDIIDCEFIKMLKSLDFTLDEIVRYKDCLDEEIIIKKKKEIEERMYILKKQYDRLLIMQKEVSNREVLENLTEEERVLKRKYEKRDIGKYN